MIDEAALGAKPRVLLLVPRFSEGYQSLGPLGVACLAAYLEDISAVNIVYLGADQSQSAQQALQEFEPDIVGVSGFATPCIPGVLQLAQAIKAQRPGTMVVTGGVGATFLADQILHSGYVDAVVRGVRFF